MTIQIKQAILALYTLLFIGGTWHVESRFNKADKPMPFSPLSKQAKKAQAEAPGLGSVRVESHLAPAQEIRPDRMQSLACVRGPDGAILLLRVYCIARSTPTVPRCNGSLHHHPAFWDNRLHLRLHSVSARLMGYTPHPLTIASSTNNLMRPGGSPVFKTVTMCLLGFIAYQWINDVLKRQMDEKENIQNRGCSR